MCIYSIRATTVKLIGMLLLCAVVIVGLALAGQNDSVSAMSSSIEIDYDGIKSKEDRIAFIESFGIKIDSESESEEAFRMPESLDRVILGYNELQKKQGLDITKYKNKKVTRYTYKVTNYKDSGEVYANIFIHRGKVVACDLSSADPTGFVIPLTRVERGNLK